MTVLHLRVLNDEAYRFLADKNPLGYYDRETREKLYWIIETLRTGWSRCSRQEKKLFKKFSHAKFGILLPRWTVSQGRLTVQGNLCVEGRFDGELRDVDTVIIQGSGWLVSDVVASTVLCLGKVDGNIRASRRVWLASSAQIRGDIQTPKITIAKGALFEGQCTTSRQETIRQYPKGWSLARFLKAG